MPSCITIDPLVTPYIDGQLAADERALVEQHIQACAPCRSRVAAERSICQLLHERKAELCASHAPERLRSRCRASTRRITAAPVGVRTAPWSARMRPLALAALFLLVVAGAVGYRATLGATEAIAAELTADHVKCFMMNAVLRTHDTVQDVEAELQSGFQWAVQLPEHPEHEGLELVGSRPCLYEHGKIAHIMYRHKGVPVSIFMLPGTSRPKELLEALGHDAVVWSDEHRTFVLIARAPKGEVEQIAAFVQTSLR